MTAGMPGTGIGGLFYLLSALLMPFRELWRAASGRSRADQRRNVLQQCLLAAAILGALSVTGLLLGRLPGTDLPPGHGASAALRVFYVAPVAVAFGTLMSVLVMVEVARVLCLRRCNATSPTGDIPPKLADKREAA